MYIAKPINVKAERKRGNFCRYVLGFSFATVTFCFKPPLAPGRFAPNVAIMFKPTKIFIGSIQLKNFSANIVKLEVGK